MDKKLGFEKLAGLQFDLVEASKAPETFSADDIRNMFNDAGYIVEFDNYFNNYEACYYAYISCKVTQLLYFSKLLVEVLQKQALEKVFDNNTILAL